MLNNAVRVENEVAAITLMRYALSSHESGLVPEVYGWNTAAEGRGWIIEERMHGQALHKIFPIMSFEHQEEILQQIARVFKAIQSYELPNTITGYGGLTFGAKGEVISGATTIWFGGPSDTFKYIYAQIFEKQLEFAETTKLVNGCKENPSLRQRLRTFQCRCLEKVLKNFSVTRRTLVHGDLGE